MRITRLGRSVTPLSDSDATSLIRSSTRQASTRDAVVPKGSVNGLSHGGDRVLGDGRDRSCSRSRRSAGCAVPASCRQGGREVAGDTTVVPSTRAFDPCAHSVEIAARTVHCRRRPAVPSTSIADDSSGLGPQRAAGVHRLQQASRREPDRRALTDRRPITVPPARAGRRDTHPVPVPGDATWCSAAPPFLCGPRLTDGEPSTVAGARGAGHRRRLSCRHIT